MAKAVEAGGLRKGQKATVQEIEAAAQKLLQSGFFESVGYQYFQKKSGVDLEFQVEEADDFLPCIFDNFVWFSDEELIKAIQARVPLFKGSVPRFGKARQDMVRALQDLLVERKIPGTVRLVIDADLKKGKLANCLFRVIDVNLPIYLVQFRGVSSISEAALKEKTKSLVGQQYSKRLLDETLVPMFKKKGYLRVQLQEPSIEIQTKSMSEFGISVILNVIEGEKYRWDKAVWSGDLPLPPEDLDRIVGMKTGDVADSDIIDEGIAAVSRELRKKGYIDAWTKETMEINDSARAVRYTIQLFAGSKYAMGSLTFKGVTDKIANKLRSKWKIAAGENFDALYAEEFLEKDAKDIIASNRLAPLSRIALPDREKSIVNVLLEFQQLPKK